MRHWGKSVVLPFVWGEVGRALGACLAGSLLCSCSTLGSYRTAEVPGKGKSECGVALTLSQAAPEGTDAFGEPVSPSLYMAVEVAYRYGVMDRVDLGGKVTGGGKDLGFLLDTRLQFLDGDSFDAAICVGAGRSGWDLQGAGPDGDSSLRLTARDIVVILPLTYHFSEKFNLTATPRFIKRRLAGTAGSLRQELVGIVLTGSIAAGEGERRNDRILMEVGFSKADGVTYSHLGFALQGDEPSVYWRGLAAIFLGALQGMGEAIGDIHCGHARW